MDSFILKPAKGSIKKKIRKGRGNSSGHGGESGRGHKGQKSRTGYSRRSGFEGGQIPLYRRLPKKRGIDNTTFREDICIVNLKKIQDSYSEGEQVDINSLSLKGFVKSKKGTKLKVLGQGDIQKKLTVSAHYFSKSAIEKLNAAGCNVHQLSGK